MGKPKKWIQSRPEEPVAVVARRSLKRLLRDVVRAWPAAAKKWRRDPEHVHRLRVASRRGQAAIDIYQELLPARKAAWMRKQLKQIRKATNDARDDDVFAERLAEDRDLPAARRLAERVASHRRTAQRSVKKCFRKQMADDKLKRKVDRLVSRIRYRPGDPAVTGTADAPTYRQWVAVKLRQRIDEFERLAGADFDDVEALHRFRICGKKLRYGLELSAGAVPDEPRRRVYRSLTRLQNRLGNINDHAAAAGRIAYWIGEAQGDDAEQTGYLHEMLCREQQAMQQACQKFRRWWTDRRESEIIDRLKKLIASIEEFEDVRTGA